MASNNIPVPHAPCVLPLASDSSDGRGLRLFTSIGGGEYTGCQVDTGSEGILISRSLLGHNVVDKKEPFPDITLWPSGLKFTGTWVHAMVSFSSKRLAPGAPGEVTTVLMSVKAVDEIIDKNGHSKPSTGTALIGVGFDRNTGPLKPPFDINPFLLTAPMVAGIFRPGFILDWQARTITLGITDENTQGFETIPLVRDGNKWDAPIVNIDLPDSGIHIPNARFLMDCGIPNASIIAPPQDKPPLVEPPKEIPYLADGQHVAVSSSHIKHHLFAFTTGVAATNAPTPVNWGHVIGTHGPSINTGRHALDQFKYMYDAGHGVMGFQFIS